MKAQVLQGEVAQLHRGRTTRGQEAAMFHRKIALLFARLPEDASVRSGLGGVEYLLRREKIGIPGAGVLRPSKRRQSCASGRRGYDPGYGRPAPENPTRTDL